MQGLRPLPIYSSCNYDSTFADIQMKIVILAKKCLEISIPKAKL